MLREESDCWLCGDPVDKTLPPYLSGSPEVDEVIPVSLGGDPFDRRNCRLSHRICNVRRGNGTKPKRQSLDTPRRWWGDTLPPGPQATSTAMGLIPPR